MWWFVLPWGWASIPTPDDPARTIRKKTLLLQTSVRELNPDLLVAETAAGPPEQVAVEGGRKQINCTVLRSISPSFELRRLSRHLRDMHCFRICESIKSFKRDAQNQSGRMKRHQLRVLRLDELPENGRTRSETDGTLLMNLTCLERKLLMIASCKTRGSAHPCAPPVAFVGSGLTKPLPCCSAGSCANCPVALQEINH